MDIFESWRTLPALAATAFDILRLPKASLRFERALNPGQIEAVHAAYTQPHPRYKVVRHKSVGMALIALRSFRRADDYLDAILHRDQGGFQRKKARSRGYSCAEVDRNDHLEAIDAIHRSIVERQGRPLEADGRGTAPRYRSQRNLRCFGVLDAEGTLVAYCNVAVYGNFAATERLMGMPTSDGIMYLLLSHIACTLIDEARLHYLMYDTFLGAQPGLRRFKMKLGFRPYRIRYSIQ